MRAVRNAVEQCRSERLHRQVGSRSEEDVLSYLSVDGFLYDPEVDAMVISLNKLLKWCENDPEVSHLSIAARMKEVHVMYHQRFSAMWAKNEFVRVIERSERIPLDVPITAGGITIIHDGGTLGYFTEYALEYFRGNPSLMGSIARGWVPDNEVWRLTAGLADEGWEEYWNGHFTRSPRRSGNSL